MREEIHVMRGIARKEFVDYFLTQGAQPAEDTIYRGEGWEVEIGKEDHHKILSGKIPQVELIFHLDEKCCEHLMRAFFIRFMRAGG